MAFGGLETDAIPTLGPRDDANFHSFHNDNLEIWHGLSLDVLSGSKVSSDRDYLSVS
jgi:hypothetical protein